MKKRMLIMKMLIIIAIILAILLCWANIHALISGSGWVNAGSEFLIASGIVVLLHVLLLFILIGTAKRLPLDLMMFVWGLLIFLYLLPTLMSLVEYVQDEIRWKTEEAAYHRITAGTATMDDFVCCYKGDDENMIIDAFKYGYRGIADTILTAVCDTSSNRIFNNSDAWNKYVEKYGKKIARSKVLGVCLVTATKQGPPEVVKALLDAGADVNQVKGWDSPLTIAIEEKQLDIVNLFLERGADVNLTSSFYSPLIVAARTGQLDIARSLLKRGANVNLVDHTSPLIAAISAEQSDMVHLFLEQGADVNLTTDTLNSTGAASPLIAAISAEQPDMVHLLLERGADVNLMTGPSHQFGAASPLIAAVNAEQPDMVHLLLEQGADVNALDSDKLDALLYAVRKDNVDIVKLLIKHGANVKRKYPKHLNGIEPYEPLLYFAKALENRKIIDYLTSEYPEVLINENTDE